MKKNTKQRERVPEAEQCECCPARAIGTVNGVQYCQHQACIKAAIHRATTPARELARILAGRSRQ